MTRPIQANQAGRLSRPAQWQEAMAWVDANPHLLRQIADQYKRYMASDSGDLRHEGYMAAIEALEAIYAAGLPMDTQEPCFGAFFRVKFRNRCIVLAQPAPANGFDTDLPAHTPEDHLAALEDEEICRTIALRQARLLPRKQKFVTVWVLTREYPVTNHDISKKFKICDRYVRQLLEWSSETIGNRARFFYGPSFERADRYVYRAIRPDQHNFDQSPLPPPRSGSDQRTLEQQGSDFPETAGACLG